MNAEELKLKGKFEASNKPVVNGLKFSLPMQPQ
jgi:hypothetical protein